MTPRQRGEMRFHPVELKRHRARIVRIEHDEVDDGCARRDHEVALPIGDLAIGKLEKHFEATVGRAGEREGAHQAAGDDASLDAAAEFEEAPARKLRHVFLRQPGKR